MIVPESIIVQMWGENEQQVVPIKKCKYLSLTLTIILFLVGYLLGFITLYLIDYYTIENKNICYSI
jgi:hypothetical protein